MSHTCHWPGCPKEVPPSMWGCKTHWFKLPLHLRNKIWQTYRAGQEITKTPSIEYIAAAQEVQQWINQQRFPLCEERAACGCTEFQQRHCWPDSPAARNPKCARRSQKLGGEHG